MSQCKCDTCLYTDKIMAIAAKQKDPHEKKEIEDLWERAALAEDDNGLYRGRWQTVKPILHVLGKEHFQNKGHQIRKDGHDACQMCSLLENVL